MCCYGIDSGRIDLRLELWTNCWIDYGIGVGLYLVRYARTATPEPILPMGLFKIRNYTLSMLLISFYTATFIGVVSFVGLYYQYCKNMTAIMSGLATLPFTAGMMIGAPVSGVIVTHKYAKYLICGSCLIFSCGVGLMRLWTVSIPYWQNALILFTVGVGGGAPIGACPFIAQSSVKAKDIAVAISCVAFFRSLGGAIGVAVYQSIFNGRLSHYIHSVLHFSGPAQAFSNIRLIPEPLRIGYAYALSWTFFSGVPFAILAAVFAICLGRILLTDEKIPPTAEVQLTVKDENSAQLTVKDENSDNLVKSV